MTEERIIAYLLGELPEEEAERFEDECFAGESWPAEINLVEEDLIDDYLRRELAPERRQRFEENYLTTDARVERVRTASALLRHVDGHAVATDVTEVAPPAKENKRGAWLGALWGGRLSATPAAFAVAMLVVVAVGAYFALRFTAPSDRAVVMVALTPSSADRGGGAEIKKVKLPADAGALKASLMLPEGHTPSARYRVELEDDRGRIQSLDAAGQDAQSVSVVLPAALLARGQYALRLFTVSAEGVEQRVRGSYLFSVE
jgi:methionine-rich copper-binding protein CopC